MVVAPDFLFSLQARAVPVQGIVEVDSIYSEDDYSFAVGRRMDHFITSQRVISFVRSSDLYWLLYRLADRLSEEIPNLIKSLSCCGNEQDIEELTGWVEKLELCPEEDEDSNDFAVEWIIGIFHYDRIAKEVSCHSQFFNNWVANWHAMYLSVIYLEERLYPDKVFVVQQRTFLGSA